MSVLFEQPLNGHGEEQLTTENRFSSSATYCLSISLINFETNGHREEDLSKGKRTFEFNKI